MESHCCTLLKAGGDANCLCTCIWKGGRRRGIKRKVRLELHYTNSCCIKIICKQQYVRNIKVVQLLRKFIVIHAPHITEQNEQAVEIFAKHTEKLG